MTGKISENNEKTGPERGMYDAAVIGGGIAGLTLSCLLGNRGLRVCCIDREDISKQVQADRRTTAISAGSARVLAEAGVWETLKPLGCPIEDIRILDGDSPVLLNFLCSELEDPAAEAFGWIIDNGNIRRALSGRLKALKTVDYIAPVCVRGLEAYRGHVAVSPEDGRILRARLAVGADGRGSLVREAMNVETRGWPYNQRAVICTVRHEHPHGNAAVEHFHPGGPFAILPMIDDEQGNHRSSVVFTEHGPARRSLMSLDEKTFEAALAARFPESYGAVALEGGRACHPLGLIHAATYTAPRMALVGDAAHGIHPVAGQGLNLGFRDVAALARLAGAAFENGEDPGGEKILRAYQQDRRFDTMAMIAVTDALVRLFSNDLPPVRLLRRAGLRLVAKLPPAKRFFMRRAMGI